MKKDILIKALQKVQIILSDKDRAVITGSNALRIYGLLDFEEKENKPSDLDIVLLTPTEETLNTLKKLQEINPADTRAPEDGEYPTSNNIVSIISLRVDEVEVKIDFFKAVDDYEDKLTDTKFYGFRVAGIKSIIAAKKSYNRDKDQSDLSNWANIFYDHKKGWSDKIAEIFKL